MGSFILVFSLSVVFDGVIFGDYCSLIFDMIVMSSMVSVCDYIDYVWM